MKKLIIVFSFLFIAAFSYAAFTVITNNRVTTEKFDDKPKKETEKTTATTETAKEDQKTEQTTDEKTDKKECTKATTGCSKDEKGSCCKK
jgi:hypothetical protein